jgi:hypothetical protein
MPINLVSSVPSNARDLAGGNTLGGIWDPPLIVHAKSPVFVRLANTNDVTVQCTLEADIPGKDEGNTFHVQLNSKVSLLFQLDTSADADADGTYEWKIDCSTSRWDPVGASFLILG